MAYTQHDSPGGSMRCSQRTFRPSNKEDRQTYIFTYSRMCLRVCKCPALSLLYERCADADDITSSACCESLCDLVQCGRADCTLMLHKLLNAAPVARCVYRSGSPCYCWYETDVCWHRVCVAVRLVCRASFHSHCI